MKTFFSLVIAGMGILCLLPSVFAQTATWKSTASSSDWSTTTNWVEGVIPTTSSSVVINACNTCPNLSSNISVNSLIINTGGGIHLQNFTISCSTTQIRNAIVNSAGGKILAGSISEVYRNTFNGTITLEKNGSLLNNWSGGNVFNGPTSISFNVTVSDFSYLRTGYYEADTFYEEVIVNNFGGTGIAVGAGGGGAPSVFKKKLTCNSNNRHRQGLQLPNIRCEGELVLNAQYVGNILVGSIYQNRSNFLGTVTANLLSADFYGGNGVFFDNCSFQAPVIIKSTSTNLVQYNTYGIFFGRYNGTCLFTTTASMSVNGFLRGDLSLERCLFQSTANTHLDLSSGTSSTHRVGRLIVGTGTSFSGAFEAKAPNIFLNGATFNQEATLTKTGTGINNSVGGNNFRKKLTVTNQADVNSPMNLATQANDIIQH